MFRVPGEEASNMAVERVQLSHAHGTRYTAVDGEWTYQCWHLGADRSLRKVAELSGISHSTLATWSKEKR